MRKRVLLEEVVGCFKLSHHRISTAEAPKILVVSCVMIDGRVVSTRGFAHPRVT